MNPEEKKAVKLALWGFGILRKKFIVDANLFKQGMKDPNTRHAAEMMEQIQQAVKIFEGWLNDHR